MLGLLARRPAAFAFNGTYRFDKSPSYRSLLQI
jgi:hypothetical protein